MERIVTYTMFSVWPVPEFDTWWSYAHRYFCVRECNLHTRTVRVYTDTLYLDIITNYIYYILYRYSYYIRDILYTSITSTILNGVCGVLLYILIHNSMNVWICRVRVYRVPRTGISIYIIIIIYPNLIYLNLIRRFRYSSIYLLYLSEQMGWMRLILICW